MSETSYYKKALLLLSAFSSLPNRYIDFEYGLKRSEPKPMRKCLLKSCNILTPHNGGYCCAEHCKEDRKEVTPDE